MSIKNNLEKIKNDIDLACKRVGRINDVKIIAVTKYVDDNIVEEAIKSGVEYFAENRAENYKKRKEKFPNKQWHLIGTLQTRKVRDVINNVEYFHALDRYSLAKEIEKRSEKIVNCFVQVNVSKEESKHGLDESSVEEFILSLEQFSKIKVVGFMTMAPLTDDEKVIRECFKKLKTIQEKIKKLNLSYAPCNFLSMGMSNDYIIAVEEGATHIRVGTSLVGK